jgi:uncharacterized SAM-binding protein YcdF (DUF218 family)
MNYTRTAHVIIPNMKLNARILMAAVLILVLPAMCSGLLSIFGTFLVVNDKLKPSDAIVILSGGDETRVDEGARLFNQGYAGKMILTRTEVDPEDPAASAVYALRDRAVELGVPYNSIVITKRVVDTTRDEADIIRRTMEYEKYSSCIVVTEPYHTRRTSIIFQNALRGTPLTAAIHPVPDHWYQADHWWDDEKSRNVTLTEYFKLAGLLLGI